MDTSASWQDTKDPICAMSTATPTDRRKVLLPPMFGPVMMWNRPVSVCGQLVRMDHNYLFEYIHLSCLYSYVEG